MLVYWRGKQRDVRQSAELPYANGLPTYYKLRLTSCIMRVCVAATASMSAVVVASSLLSPLLVIMPWAYTLSELIFAALSYRRWKRFDNLKHDAQRGSQPALMTAASDGAAAASKRFQAVAAVLSRGGSFEVERFLRLWFHDRPLADIGRGNLKDLLAYAFFYAESSSVVSAQGHEALLDSMADDMELLLLQPIPNFTPSPAAPNLAPDDTTLTAPAAPLTVPSPIRTDLANALAACVYSCTNTMHVTSPPFTNSNQLQEQPLLFAAADLNQPQPESAALAVSDADESATLAASPCSSSEAATTASMGPPRRRLKAGTTPGLRFMAHMLEPLPHFYRPWIFYAGMEAMAWINHCMLVSAGYQRVMLPPPRLEGSHSRQAAAAASAPGCKALSGIGCDGKCQGGTPSNVPSDRAHPHDHYYYVANVLKNMDKDSSDSAGAAIVPIIFLHGVGMGLMPYLRLLVALAATGAPIIAFELKHVSQRWTSGEPPSLKELAGDVVSALRRHGFDQAAILAHSFGTAVASVLLQTYPGIVRHVTMVDPICFNMHTPTLLRNFIYRRLGSTAAAAAVSASAANTAAAVATAGAVMCTNLSEAAGAQPTLLSSSKSVTMVTGSALNTSVVAVQPLGATRDVELTAAVPPSGLVASVADDDGTVAETALPAAISSSGGGGGIFASAVSLLHCAAGLILDLLMLGPARELHCTALLCRRVVWSEVNLWEHMVTDRCSVVLSGRDDLMCARALECWLRDHTPAHVVVHPELFHAQICVAWSRQDEVLDRMLRAVYGGSNNPNLTPAALATDPAKDADITDGAATGCEAPCNHELTREAALQHGPIYGSSQVKRAFQSGRWWSYSAKVVSPWVCAQDADPWVQATDIPDARVSSVAVANGPHVDSDDEVISSSRKCGREFGRWRRESSLDSPRGFWHGSSCSGGGDMSYRWQRAGSTGGSGRRLMKPPRESDASEIPLGRVVVVASKPLHRLTVVRHDSAGSYLQLASGRTLLGGGAEGDE